MIAAYPLMPESPRWLVMKGRVEEAARVLEGLRPVEGNSKAVKEEIDAIEASITISDGGSITGLADMFRGPNLRRTLTAIGIGAFQ